MLIKFIIFNTFFLCSIEACSHDDSNDISSGEYFTAVCPRSSNVRVWFGNEFAILKEPGARAREIGERRRRRNAAKLEIMRNAQLSPKEKSAVDDDLNTKSRGWFGCCGRRSKRKKK